MAVESLKGTRNPMQDLQSAMSSNPLKKDTTSAQEREKNIRDAASKVDARSLMTSYVVEFQMSINVSVSTNISAQSGVAVGIGNALENPERLKSIINGLDLNSIGYKGKPLSELTQEEAKALISDDGFFGIPKTSERIADLVLAGAGDDVEKLKAGREGILRGYKQAEKSWGGELPEISQKTLEKALEKVDKKLASLGVNVLETNA
ncbi:hydrogenase-4 component G [Helicobacter sp.]|uniref:hydrogenase-4 component G n=1 Tax=Helicobacter sp. TaxID=218 RepID=UPI0025BC81ED|nr:hydrogenase-4 component G [Helicobacter sp.]MCI5968988.1 hydrogenase-4 component G [Helicobacter sp.]MDY2584136.1 hydrogenase-4 component G [Helicobacter sp.]